MPISLLDEEEVQVKTEGGSQPQGTLDFHQDIVNEYMEDPESKGIMRAEFGHNKSASSAYWDPRGRQIVSTSYDDRLRCKIASCSPSAN